MNQLLISTKPGDTIELWKWNNGSLVPFDTIKHVNNQGPLILPPGDYVYYILSGFGEYRVEQ